MYFCPLSACLRCSRLRALGGPLSLQRHPVNRYTRLPSLLRESLAHALDFRGPPPGLGVIRGARQHGLRLAPWPRATLLQSLSSCSSAGLALSCSVSEQLLSTCDVPALTTWQRQLAQVGSLPRGMAEAVEGAGWVWQAVMCSRGNETTQARCYFCPCDLLHGDSHLSSILSGAWDLLV